MSDLQIKVLYDHHQAQKDLQEFSPDISNDLMRQPGLFAYYSSLYCRADAQYERIKHARDVLAAKLSKVHRKALNDDGVTKVTEGLVASEVAIDPRMRKMEALLREAKEQMNLLKGTCDAFKQRRDSLMQLAFNMREEGKGQPRVMNTAAKGNTKNRINALKDRFASGTESPAGDGAVDSDGVPVIEIETAD